MNVHRDAKMARTLWLVIVTLLINNGQWLICASAWRKLPPLLTRVIIFRGGSHTNEKSHEDSEEKPSSPPSIIPGDEASFIDQTNSSKKRKHSSNMIHNLIPKSGLTDESLELRLLIGTRTKGYINELMTAAKSNDVKLPHPRKLLHYLAPKVPAIKHSPDVNLRIHSLRSAMDSGVAASMVSTLAWVCEIYDKEVMKRNAALADDADRPESVAPVITTDRRFEQLVECVLSGVNVKKRKRESLLKQLDRHNDGETKDIEEVLDGEDAQEDAGLNAIDACRAAWGIAILGAFHLETLGGEKVMDLLLSLSLRIREILLARLQLLRRDDLFSESGTRKTQSPESRLNELAEELAEDAVCAMWAFGCVKACTGMRSPPLFETCCSLLCKDPVEMRKRAQDEERGLGNMNIGASDVVDRLAKSDHDLSDQDSDGPESFQDQFGQKDALLDWLSPNMVNDILWALALHGSTDNTSLEEITLSETATTLREIAFDRLMEWLEQDLALLQRNKENEVVVASESSAETGAMTIEVVGAAELLKADDEAQSRLVSDAIQDLQMENSTLKGRRNPAGVGGVGVQKVQVVDAAKLLASVESGGPVELETEVILAPSTFVDSNVDPDGDNEEDGDLVTERGEIQSSAEELPTFTPHDLCCMAWAVTELRDQLRPQIVSLITRIFSLIGPTSTDGLNGSDLSNLAWALTRTAGEGGRVGESSDRSISLIRWIASSALQRIHDNCIDSGVDVTTVHMFQPPELGRLLWAIASTISDHYDVVESAEADEAVPELALAALMTASSNLSMFTSEDLLRISWAFLELCDTDATLADPNVAMALGKVLATVEESLDKWERGKKNAPATDLESYQPTAANLFSSFFGKPRVHLKSFDQPIADLDEEDEMSMLLGKSHLPMLRDLSIDPSTLCKAACGFARLSSKHTHLKASWPLTRVAVRLLTSKNARLMKECSIHDIVRICEAAALSEASGQGRELVIGLFVRKVLQLLNDSLDDRYEEVPGPELDLSEASPAELASLYWALGELGAKHSLADDNPGSAYRRMRLVVNRPLIMTEEVSQLSPYSLARLLHGLVGMKFASSDRRFLLDVLIEMEKKADNLTNSDLCDLVESLATIKDVVSSGFVDKKDVNQKKRDGDNTDLNSTSAAHESDRSPGETPLNVDLAKLQKDDASINGELSRKCGECISRIISRSQEQLQHLQAAELTRLLSVCTLLPFQADTLVDSIEAEVAKRKQQLLGVSSCNLADLIKDAAKLTDSLNRTVFGDSNGVSPLDHIKKGIKSFFSAEGKINDDQDQNDLENSVSEEISSLIQRAAALTSQANSKLEALGEGTLFSMDGVIEDMNKAVALELGRCQELIESYRRIEFSTGTQRSRYDKERRKDISKRVLSRLSSK